MASTTIDPLIKVSPSIDFINVVKSLIGLEREKISTHAELILPVGISSIDEVSEDSVSKNITFSVEDIKWIYERREFIDTEQNKLRGNIEKMHSTRMSDKFASTAISTSKSCPGGSMPKIKSTTRRKGIPEDDFQHQRESPRTT